MILFFSTGLTLRVLQPNDQKKRTPVIEIGAQAAGYDVVTMDTETDRKATREALQQAARGAGREPSVVQGNFDPRLLADASPMSSAKVRLHRPNPDHDTPVQYSSRAFG